MNVHNKEVKMQAKTCKQLAVEFGVHVNTIYTMRDGIAMMLNLKKGAKQLLPKQLDIFYNYYGRP